MKQALGKGQPGPLSAPAGEPLGRRYRCVRCNAGYAIDEPVWRCVCEGHLNLEPAQGLRPVDVVSGERSLWRYQGALALGRNDAVAYFGEGLTPLVQRTWGQRPVAFKLDFMLPTGSFKDRGAALMVNGIRKLGLTSIREDSSGNGGASVAAYAAAAGMTCAIYVSRSTSPAKLAQIEAYGASVVRVDGTRDDVAEAMMADRRTFCASHNWHPLFIEGLKTLGYELWEQSEWSVPDVVIAPIGYGSTVLGLHAAFRELLRAGSIPRLPRIFACQPAACPTFYNAWHRQDPTPPLLPAGWEGHTVAEGLAGTKPIRVAEVLRVFEEANGRPVVVTEEAILDAVGHLAHLGLYVEPTSAVAGAAALQLFRREEILPHERVVIVLTGSGLKTALTGGLAA